MEQWRDQALLLSARPYGDSGGVVQLLSENYGRYAGYIHGGFSSSRRGMLQPGNLVDAQWQARIADQLGRFSLEPVQALSAYVIDEREKLAALQSACALCVASIPEREAHPGLFHGLKALLEAMQNPSWEVAYIAWEIALLRELGFALELDRCAANGDNRDLIYVSPKSGRAVSRVAGSPYKTRLLILPHFLRAEKGAEAGGVDDIADGLYMTGYFLQNWVFPHTTHGVPQERVRFGEMFIGDMTQDGLNSDAGA